MIIEMIMGCHEEIEKDDGERLKDTGKSEDTKEQLQNGKHQAEPSSDNISGWLAFGSQALIATLIDPSYQSLLQ